MHILLIILACIFGLVILKNIQGIAFVVVIGIAYLLNNFLKVCWWIITSPFRLVWWIFCLPFRLIGWIINQVTGFRISAWGFKHFLHDFFFYGDWSVRLAKLFVFAFLLAVIVHQILKYVPTHR